MLASSSASTTATAAFSFALFAGIAAPCSAGDVAFRRHVINPESEFMAAAVFDVNKDGKLDIACGGFWYERRRETAVQLLTGPADAPTWKKHFLRNVEIQNGRPDGYAHQPYDVNNDSWTDIITVNWRSRSVRWIEHPGANLAKGEEWKAHTVATPGSMETGRLVDMLGDGTPCILPSTVAFWWELQRKPEGPQWIQHALPSEIAGHGVGFGDINGDGRGDVIGSTGWAEAPEDRRTGKWTWHPDFALGQASIPILVLDVDGDKLNDLLWTMGHDYGVYWLQQTVGSAPRTEPASAVRNADPTARRWVRHAIDTSWAGNHSPLWVDLDGDGKKELVVGRRYRAHEGADPGEYDPQAIYRYEFDSGTRTWKRQTISYNQDTCFGLDPVAIDLTGSGKLDLVFGGRHGLYWFENLGPGDSVAKGESPDPLKFPAYPDHHNLTVVRDAAGAEKPIKDPFDAGQRRAHTLAAMQAVMGPLPSSHQRAPLNISIVSESAADGYTRKKVTYASDLSSRVVAYLLVPNNARPAGPAMVCLHDDTPQAKDSMTVADELAKKGYVCLVPDYPGQGENPFDLTRRSDLYTSAAMKAVWDNIRGIDLLETLPEVHPKRIGIIGHGLGGQNALLTAAFDHRLAATVSISGFTTFARATEKNFAAWSSAMPRLKAVYNNDPAKIPFDFPEVLATLVPRSVLIVAPATDALHNPEAGKSAVEAASAVYQLRRVGPSLKLLQPENAADLAEITAWLEPALRPRVLGGRGRGAAPQGPPD